MNNKIKLSEHDANKAKNFISTGCSYGYNIGPGNLKICDDCCGCLGIEKIVKQYKKEQNKIKAVTLNSLELQQ